MRVFFLLLRTIGLPIAAIFIISRTWIGLEVGFLGVNVVLTIMTVPLLLWDVIKIVPNLALLRTSKVMWLLVEIVIQVVALLGFWIAYASIAG